MSLDDFTLDFEEPGARPSGESNMSAARPSASPTALPETPTTAPSSGPQGSPRPVTPPSSHETSAERGSVRAWALALGVLLLFAAGSLFAVHRHHTARYAALNAAQSQLQSALEGADDLQAAELKALTERVAALRNELDNDVPADLQLQYQELVGRISALGSSSNQQLAEAAQALTNKLTNQAGAGIALAGPNNATISNTGVLSLNSQAGNLTLQGTPNQVAVSQSGGTTTLSTPQDIATTSAPNFAGLQVAGATTTNTLAIQSTGTQNGNQLCDSSNNCGYSGVSSSYVQGGNSFGSAARLGTNDAHSLSLRTNGTDRLTIDTAGNIGLTGNLTTPGSVSAGSLSATTLSGNGSSVTNVDATALNGNTAGNSSGQIALNNTTLNTNLNADLLDGQHGSYYQNASNLNTGTIADARLSANVALQNAANTFTLQQNFAGGFLATNGTMSGTLTAAALIQGASAVCDASNNCGFATNSQFSQSILQGGNSFGAAVVIGANDANALQLKANNSVFATISVGTGATWNLTSSGSFRAGGGEFVAWSVSNKTLNVGPHAGSFERIYIGHNGSATSDVRVFVGEHTGTPSGKLHVRLNGSFPSTVGLVVQGAIAQTGDLLQLQNSSGTALTTFGSDGTLILSDTSNATRIRLAGSGTSTKFIRFDQGSHFNGYDLGKNASGWFVVQGSVNTTNKIAYDGATGAFSINGNPSGAAIHARVVDLTHNTIVSQGIQDQTGDLFQAKGWTGTVLARIAVSGDLFVRSASVTGTLTVNGHIVTANLAGSTSAAPQAACGTGCSTSVSGNDTSGTITITSGASGVAAGKQAVISFGSSFGAAPRVVLTPRGANAAGLGSYELDTSTTSFSIGVLNAPAPSTSYTFNYWVAQ